MNLQSLHTATSDLSSSERMPLMFVGHGSPMNAILDNSFTKTWKEMGKHLPRPKAILSISAHWITRHGTKVTAMAKPETIHDFGGFPDELYVQQYPAPGSPEFAEETRKLVAQPEIAPDTSWGLDHGTWSVLLPMFPLADIPVFQLSIDYSQPPQYHFDLAKQLKALREKGVLVMGSGNIVHNLRAIRMDGATYDWATEFDGVMKNFLEEGNDRSIVDFQKLGSLASLAHPTIDHFLPLLYVIAMRGSKDNLSFFNNQMDLGSISMRSMLYK
jgi:4,5-DOPA dioxygenase extradiol